MIRRRLNHLDFFLRLAVLWLPLLSFAVAAYLRFWSGWFPVADASLSYSDYFGLLLFSTIVWAIIVDHYRLAQVELLADLRNAGGQAFIACVVSYVAITGASFFYRAASYSRLFVVFSGFAMFLMVLATQRAFRGFLNRMRRNGEKFSRILVVGADDYAERVARELVASFAVPSKVAAFVRLPGQNATCNSAPVYDLGLPGATPDRLDVTDIVIALPLPRMTEIPEILARLEPFCVPIRAALDLGPLDSVRDSVFQVGNVRLVDLRVTPVESVTYSILKRSFDFIFSLIALAISAPVWLVIALLIKLESQGPVFFIQERVGLNGKPFLMYKFRTMRPGEPGESETRWTTRDDTRRTKIGTFLRRSNLDELPQFLNVLKGDMSVVGPRPERPYFVRKYLESIATYNTRHFLKVGITGWAQVNGWRGDTSIVRRVEYDLDYLRNWSLATDLKIIGLTVWRGFFDRNAY